MYATMKSVTHTRGELAEAADNPPRDWEHCLQQFVPVYFRHAIIIQLEEKGGISSVIVPICGLMDGNQLISSEVSSIA